MSDSELIKILEKAKSFVSEASEVTRQGFAEGFKTEQKRDTSLVTEIDIKVEKLLRERIMQLFPDHGILGEEGEDHNPGASFCWVLDPIDGTQSFVHGVPTFGSIVALLRDNQPVIGLIDHPMLNEQYYAAKGFGAYCNDKKISIRDGGGSTIDTNEIITICSRKQWEISNQRHLFDQFWNNHSFFRIYYDCFALSRAAAGQTGACIEMNVNLWDIAPCKVMIEEAGGRYVDLGTFKKPDGKLGYSMIMGKPSVTKVLETWLKG